MEMPGDLPRPQQITKYIQFKTPISLPVIFVKLDAADFDAPMTIPLATSGSAPKRGNRYGGGQEAPPERADKMRHSRTGCGEPMRARSVVFRWLGPACGDRRQQSVQGLP